MRRILFIVFSVMFTISLDGQVTEGVIASSGGYNTNVDLSMSWTLGELVILTFTSQDGTVVLSDGFQQMLIVTAIEEAIVEPVQIKIFPNPVSEVMNIQFETPVDAEIILYIIDSQGKLIRTDTIEATETEKQINFHDIPAGIYFLRMTNGKNINVYKVVKL